MVAILQRNYVTASHAMPLPQWRRRNLSRAALSELADRHQRRCVSSLSLLVHKQPSTSQLLPPPLLLWKNEKSIFSSPPCSFSPSNNKHYSHPPQISHRRVVTSLLFRGIGSSDNDDANNNKHNSNNDQNQLLSLQQHRPPWHDPNFMKESSPEEVENWLLSLLKSVQDAGGGGSDQGTLQNPTINFNAYYNHGQQQQQRASPMVLVVDAIAYLRVLEKYARMNTHNDNFRKKKQSGERSGGGGAPQKVEYWLMKLERHYEAALESFSATYGLLDHHHDNDDSNGVVDVDVKNHDNDKAEDDDSSDQSDLKPKKSAFAAFLSSKTKAAPSSSTTSTKQNATTKSRTQKPVPKTPTHHTIQSQIAATIVRSLQPTVECYNAAIEAWGNDTNRISVVRSRRWLSKLQEEEKKNVATASSSITALAQSSSPSSLRPNAKSYDLYLCSCSRGIGKQQKLFQERAQEAQAILQYRMSPDAPSSVRPTTESFNYVLRAWTRCRKEYSVADRVLHLVRQMEGIQRDVILKEETGERLKDDEEWKRNIVPNSKTYTMAIDAWIIAAGSKADAWYSEQLDHYNNMEKQRDGRGPSRQHAANNSKNGMYQNKHKLDASGEEDDGTKEMKNAESILTYIRDLEEIGHVDSRATLIAYNTLLSGWARLANEFRPDIPKKSEALLHEMIELSKSGDENFAPDVISFNAVRCFGGLSNLEHFCFMYSNLFCPWHYFVVRFFFIFSSRRFSKHGLSRSD